MLDADGLPRTMPFSIAELTQHCIMNGYFIYGGTIYACIKIREGVTKEELRAYSVKKDAREKARYAEYLKEMQNVKDHK